MQLDPRASGEHALARPMAKRILVVDDSRTLRRVVADILEGHGYVTVLAKDGQDALEVLSSVSEPIDLALVDFWMPRLDGYQLCRQLRSRDLWRKIPVVLMSAKSDRIREQFVEQTGAIDAITKPFDAQALLAVVGNALRRVERGRTPVPGAIHEERLTTAPPPPDEGAARAQAAIAFGSRLAAVLAPAISALRPEEIGREAQLTQAILQGLSPSVLADLSGSLRQIEAGDGGPGILSGDLSAIPFGAILQLLQMEAQTGVLHVSNVHMTVVCTLRGGLIDMVQSRGGGDEFRLGRFFVERGLVTPEELDDLVAARLVSAPPAPLLGDLLIQTGKVNEAQLRDALVRQSSELVYEALRWQKGRFELRRQVAPALAGSARLGLPVAAVVMEGFRRVDEWRMFEAKVGRFDEVLFRDPTAIEALGEGRLTRLERLVLAAVDGERSLREVIAATHLSSFETCRILVQFIEARLVRRRAS